MPALVNWKALRTSASSITVMRGFSYRGSCCSTVSSEVSGNVGCSLKGDSFYRDAVMRLGFANHEVQPLEFFQDF